jgi:hypothetical protein
MQAEPRPPGTGFLRQFCCHPVVVQAAQDIFRRQHSHPGPGSGVNLPIWLMANSSSIVEIVQIYISTVWSIYRSSDVWTSVFKQVIAPLPEIEVRERKTWVKNGMKIKREKEKEKRNRQMKGKRGRKHEKYGTNRQCCGSESERIRIQDDSGCSRIRIHKLL